VKVILNNAAVDRILSTHERAGAPKVAVDLVRGLLADEEQIETAGYAPQRAAELKQARRDEATAAIVDALAALEADEAQAHVERVMAADREAQERAARADGHVVDVGRITVALTAAEIVLLLREAEAADAESLRRTWAFAEPKLRSMAADEMRKNRVPHAGSAFHALTTWQAQMKTLSQRAPSLADVSNEGARRVSTIRQYVLDVARVVGLDKQVEAAATKAAVRRASEGQPPVAESGIQVGRFFDQFGTTNRRVRPRAAGKGSTA
jgi:hypothetical protein